MRARVLIAGWVFLGGLGCFGCFGCGADFTLPAPRPPAPTTAPALALEDTEAFFEEEVRIRATPPTGEPAEVFFGAAEALAVSITADGWRARVPQNAGEGRITVRGRGWSAEAPQEFRFLGLGHHNGFPVVQALPAPARPGGVAVAGGVAAVVLEDLGSLALFRLLDRRPVAIPLRAGVTADPAAAPDAPRMAYLAEGGRLLVVVQIADGVLETVVSEACVLDLGEAAASVVLVPGGDALALHVGTRRARRVRATPPCALLGALDLDVAGQRAVAGPAGTALVLAPESSDALLLDSAGPTLLARTRLAGRPVDAVLDASRSAFRVVESLPHSVAELDATSLDLVGRTAILPAARAALDGSARLWLTHPERGAVSLVSGGWADLALVGGSPGGVAAHGEVALVADGASRSLRGLSGPGRGAELWRAPLLAGLAGVAASGERVIAASRREPVLFAWSGSAARALHVGGAPLGPVAALPGGRFAAIVAGATGARVVAVDFDAGSVDMVGDLGSAAGALAVGAGGEIAAGQGAAVALFTPVGAGWTRTAVDLPEPARGLVSRGGGRFAASLPGARALAIIASGAAVALEPLPFAPAALSYSPRAGTSAAAEVDAPRVWVWRAGEAPLPVALPGPVEHAEGLAHSPDGAYVYAAVTSRDLVAMISMAEARVVKIFTSVPAPRGVASTPDGARLLVTSQTVPDLFAID